ncbi:hypothetical protein [Streptomyces profundus]|uniref:hypothetical protein n=1 Tax=Streptomyces profundus TaxID=2867410 RepID=UPI001D16ACEF|nr:hypothetical protein [Streptomyces sp. MA3_2.13]UED84044.1 hypothetical protein K4G22_07325 [Streptomyces sp. MA3_2.13]
MAAYRAKDAVFDGELTCDGEVMRPGDACVVFGGDGGGSYAEMLNHARANANNDAWVYAEFTGTVGILLLLASPASP